MRVLVTGGAGFLGTNLALDLVAGGCAVLAFDNLSGQASVENVRLLREQPSIEIVEGDIRDETAWASLPPVDVVVHAAANVNWKKALSDPLYDFSINALGTLQVLEWARNRAIPVLYISSIKVYSDAVNRLQIQELPSRFALSDQPQGIDESFPVNLNDGTRGVYGCSKLAGEIYCHEFARLYGLPVIVNRLSSIYGPYQRGSEGYGWATWFIRAIKGGQTIRIFGTGKQVRDLLHINDLTRLITLQIHDISRRVGEIYNVGGGCANGLSLLEYVELLEDVGGRGASLEFLPARPSDFLVYISDVRKAFDHFGWKPIRNVREEIAKLWATV